MLNERRTILAIETFNLLVKNERGECKWLVRFVECSYIDLEIVKKTQCIIGSIMFVNQFIVESHETHKIQNLIRIFMFYIEVQKLQV